MYGSRKVGDSLRGVEAPCLTVIGALSVKSHVSSLRGHMWCLYTRTGSDWLGAQLQLDEFLCATGQRDRAMFPRRTSSLEVSTLSTHLSLRVGVVCYQG